MSAPDSEGKPLWKVISREFPSRFSTGKNRRLATVAIGLMEAGLRIEFHVISAVGVVPDPLDLELWARFDNLIYWAFKPYGSDPGYEIVEGIDCRQSDSIPESCGRDLETTQFDGLIFTSIDLVPSLWKFCPPSIPRVLEMDEMESGRHQEFASLSLPDISDAERSSFIAKSILEKIWIPRFDLVALSSRAEVEKARNEKSSEEVSYSVWPNIADPLESGMQREPSESLALLFVGHLGYPPNQDAVLWLAEEIFPLIQERLPDARCMIVGLRCPDSLSKRLSASKVEYLGSQPDLSRFYATATAAIVPLRAGTGTRIKILEAFALGCPVVSTTKGAEGLGLTSGKELMIADDPQSLLDACIKIHNESLLREKLVLAGKAFWESGHTQKALNNVIACDIDRLQLD